MHDWLLKALLRQPPEAGEAWRSWRTSVDLNNLDPASFWMLPTLAGRMQGWIGSDRQQDILTGICRRAWSQNQLLNQLGSEAFEVLRAAGIDALTWAGPIRWAQLYWPQGAIRPLETLDLLLEPEAITPAMEALSKAEWAVGGTFANYFSPAIHMRYRDKGLLRLHWRPLPNTDFALRRPALSPAPALAAEYDFLRVLGGEFDDALDWRCDALMICAARSLDWERIAGLLKWRSRAKARLEQLCRQGSIEVPGNLHKKIRRTVGNRLVTGSLGTYRRIKQTGAFI